MSLHSRRPARGPILTREHRRARLDFAQDHQHWQLLHWRPILFTDESRFHVYTCDRRVGVWRWAGERYADSNIVEYDRYSGRSVMVWGGICLDGPTVLVVIDRGAVSGCSPWTGGMTLCRGFRSVFCIDARQCPTSHGQSRPSLPGAGRYRRHGVASAIPRLESDWAFVGHPPETCFRAS